MDKLTAIEFFSGIGAFTQAAKSLGLPVTVAFDQSSHANRAYESNYELKPHACNLDTVKADDLPQADIWWLSPPCKPFSVRGKGKDDADSRSRCLSNLMQLIPQLRPRLVLVENVLAFAGSQMHQKLLDKFAQSGLHAHQIELCPTMFGVPMRRPRLFMAAASDEKWFEPRLLSAATASMQPLAQYLQPEADKRLELPEAVLDRYGTSLHIIDNADADAVATCFTSGYGRCMKAAGSFLRSKKGDGKVRRFSPREQLALFGFSGNFVFPEEIDLKAQWRLIGNSVDVRAIKYLLSACPVVSAIL